MHFAYPIEQLARSARTKFQMGFARMTMHLVPAFEEAVLQPSTEGLKIFATSECALTLPGEVLRQIHADDVEIGEPQVRLYYGDAVQEPIMWLRAIAPREHTEAVIHDLIRRGVEIEYVDWPAPKPAVRAKAPLRRLLGYPRALAGLSGNTADLHMRLSHYAPVPPEPGQAA